MEDVLLFFAMKYDGDSMKIYNALESHEKIDIELMKQYQKEIRYKNTHVMKQSYPDYLKKVDNPPILLFYEGNINLLHDDVIKYGSLENGRRYMTSMYPIEKDGKVIFDYVIACERQEDLDKLLKHMKSKGLPLKDYSKSKEKDHMKSR